MLRDRIGEMVLSMVMPRDRAVAVAGDFAESARSGGVVVWHVALTVGARVIGQWRSAPVKLAVGAFLLWLMMLALTAMLVIVAWLGWAVLYLLGHHTGLELVVDVPVDPPAPVALWVYTAVLPAIAGWKLGKGTAKMWPGRELAIWTAVLIVWSCLSAWGMMPLAMLILPPQTFLAGVWRARLREFEGRAS